MGHKAAEAGSHIFVYYIGADDEIQFRGFRAGIGKGLAGCLRGEIFKILIAYDMTGFDSRAREYPFVICVEEVREVVVRDLFFREGAPGS